MIVTYFIICNRHMDTIVTLNYGLPVVMIHSENKFNDGLEVEPVIDIQKIIKIILDYFLLRKI